MIAPEIVGAYGALAVAAVGAVFGYGKLNQKVADMGKRMEGFEQSQGKQDERLSSGAVAFAHIDEGLKAIQEGQRQTQDLIKGMSDRLDRHIDGSRG